MIALAWICVAIALSSFLVYHTTGAAKSVALQRIEDDGRPVFLAAIVRSALSSILGMCLITAMFKVTGHIGFAVHSHAWALSAGLMIAVTVRRWLLLNAFHRFYYEDVSPFFMLGYLAAIVYFCPQLLNPQLIKLQVVCGLCVWGIVSCAVNRQQKQEQLEVFMLFCYTACIVAIAHLFPQVLSTGFWSAAAVAFVTAFMLRVLEEGSGDVVDAAMPPKCQILNAKGYGKGNAMAKLEQLRAELNQIPQSALIWDPQDQLRVARDYLVECDKLAEGGNWGEVRLKAGYGLSALDTSRRLKALANPELCTQCPVPGIHARTIDIVL
jgi:hypothetical protein